MLAQAGLLPEVGVALCHRQTCCGTAPVCQRSSHAPCAAVRKRGLSMRQLDSRNVEMPTFAAYDVAARPVAMHRMHPCLTWRGAQLLGIMQSVTQGTGRGWEG